MMSWLCRSCNSTTVWWQTKCSNCGRPQSYADVPATPPQETDEFQEIEDLLKRMPGVPSPYPAAPAMPFTGDCGCPPLSVCNNSMCPRGPKITFG